MRGSPAFTRMTRYDPKDKTSPVITAKAHIPSGHGGRTLELPKTAAVFFMSRCGGRRAQRAWIWSLPRFSPYPDPGLKAAALPMVSDLHPLGPEEPKREWRMTREMRYAPARKA